MYVHILVTGHLRPSRELLEYYRQKITEYDEEYEKLVKRIEKYKCTYESVVSVELNKLTENVLFT